MTITVAQAEDVLQSSFRAAWIAGGESADDIEWQNVEFDRTGRDYFVRFGINHTPRENQEIGGGDQLFTTRGGVLQVEIYVRKGDTKTKLNALREIVLGWLEQYGVGFVRFESPGLDDVQATGGWWQSNGVAIFEYDTSRDLQ